MVRVEYQGPGLIGRAGEFFSAGRIRLGHQFPTSSLRKAPGWLGHFCGGNPFNLGLERDTGKMVEDDFNALVLRDEIPLRLVDGQHRLHFARIADLAKKFARL